MLSMLTWGAGAFCGIARSRKRRQRFRPRLAVQLLEDLSRMICKEIAP
jgi:hypothetical protein